MAGESRTAVIAALAGNGALAILKGVAAAATGSAAMLAETFHSLADTGNQVLLGLGLRLAARPPDDRHPFGHGKDVYFWAFVVSVMLFTLGGAVSLREAVERGLHPEAGRASLAWAWGVLAAAFLFESGSLAVAVRSLRRVLGGRSVGEYLFETRDPTLLTVVLEDSAALASILLAAGGLGLAVLTGDGRWDAAASGLIGLLLLGVAVLLAYETHSLLIGEAAPARAEARLRAALEGDAAVRRVVTLDTLHLGPDAVLVAARVAFREELTTPAIEAVVRRLEAAAREAVHGRSRPRLVLIEPAGAPPARRRDTAA